MRMLNVAPIFVNGFHRGGTNVLMNLIASHPDVCMAAGETHEVFHGKSTEPLGKWLRRASYLPIWLLARQHIFGPLWLGERKRIPRYLIRYIDLLFYCNKLIAPENRFKAEGIENSKSEIGRSRVLSKNASGTVMATGLLSEAYPDATFIGLVRNGLALCEGMMRRGYTADYAGHLYETICQRMLDDAVRINNYHIVRFEDMISDPAACIDEVYGHAHLDTASAPKFRFEAKRSTKRDGTRDFTVGSEYKRLHWFEKQELRDHFRQDVNENQIAQLSGQDRDVFLQRARRSMERFGYLPPNGEEAGLLKAEHIRN